ncbi:phosphoribosylanthranilate isomerase [soil metagenome]
MSGVAVKICGVCSAADAELVTAAGAEYIGVILAPDRARTRTLAEAADILAASGARRVGVFVDAGYDEVLRAAERLRLDVLQLHGSEPPELVARLAESGAGVTWKAVAVRAADDVRGAAAAYAHAAHGILLDGWSSRGHGGVGARFDWNDAARALPALPSAVTLIVAGGLDSGNVGDVISLLRPAVVDVSSGVEESSCRKSAERTRAFIAAAHDAA